MTTTKLLSIARRFATARPTREVDRVLFAQLPASAQATVRERARQVYLTTQATYPGAWSLALAEVRVAERQPLTPAGVSDEANAVHYARLAKATKLATTIVSIQDVLGSTLISADIPTLDRTGRDILCELAKVSTSSDETWALVATLLFFHEKGKAR